MSDPEQPPSSVEIDNKAPNQGAQGVFHGPVYFGMSSSTARDRRSRETMLKRVRDYWIRGVLEKPVHQTPLIALGLHERSDLVENPWRTTIQEIDQPARPLPTGTRITSIYDNARDGLLILGEPGSGKTTLLLELTCDLLDRAEQNVTDPLPVIFNLSSWASKRQPLTEWLVEELNTKYQIPRKVGKEWVETDQLILLLDGLDEMPPSVRSDCVVAINTYRREHGLVPIVICSRRDAYLAQTTRIQLHKAVVVQPLTTGQIDAYLLSAGKQLEALRTALQDTPELQELATTPLTLSILVSVYEGKSVEDLLTAAPVLRQRRVFATYVQRMLERRGVETYYTPKQTIRWLSWLARQQALHSQTQFYIERMQRDWLTESQSHQRSFGIGIRLLTGLVSGLVIWLAGLSIMWLVWGLVYALFTLFTLISGLPLGLATSLRELTSWPGSYVYLLFNAQALLFSFVGGFVIGLIGGIGKEINPAEVLTWSWLNILHKLVKNLRKGILFGLLLGLLIMLLLLFAGYSNSISRTALVGRLGLSGFGLKLTADAGIGLIYAFGFGLAFTVSFGLLSGLSSEKLNEKNLAKPNQGIWLSARHSVLFALAGGLIFGLVAELIAHWYSLFFALATFGGNFFGMTVLFTMPQTIIVFVIVGVLSIGLPNGGWACIEHLVLRLLLWRAGYMPLNYPRFLDYATERILLYKVGGGYIFYHPLLRDYLATLDTSQLPELSIE